MEAQYQVVEHYSRSEFVALVNELLKSGWVLQGGLAVGASDNGSIKEYAQAMTKPAAGTRRG